MTDLADLRKPFPPEVIGKLPRVSCKECTQAKGACSRHSMGKCPECNAWITNAHIHLDYVGHAEVTDRLLSVDPQWSWEPFALDADGLPLIRNGRMWIKLTVLGVTRIGVGSVLEAKADLEKELISDALRNSAMRFGVALDLWAKADLESQIGEPEPPPVAPPVKGGRKEQGQRQPSNGTASHPVAPVANGNGMEQVPPCLDDPADPALVVKRLRLRVRAMSPASQRAYDEDAKKYAVPVGFAKPAEWTAEQIATAINLIEALELNERTRVAARTPGMTLEEQALLLAEAEQPF